MKRIWLVGTMSLLFVLTACSAGRERGVSELAKDGAAQFGDMHMVDLTGENESALNPGVDTTEADGSGSVTDASGGNGNSSDGKQTDTEKLTGNVNPSDPRQTDTEVSGGTDGLYSEVIGEKVVQTGPYGKLTITLPEGWEYQTCAVDSGKLNMGGDYGIRFYPKDAGEGHGHVELAYASSFGVCGTGLEQKELQLAGDKAYAGYYDGNTIWDYVSFQGRNKGVVADTYAVEDWWGVRENEVMDILNTLEFDPEDTQGAIGIYQSGSDDGEIGLYVYVKNITGTSATICFQQYDEQYTGELTFGEDFFIQKKGEDGTWSDAPIVFEGDWGVNDIAHIIEKNILTEYEYDWGWLFGELAPGDYRIKTHVSAQAEEGAAYTDYMLYAYFIVR